MSWHSIEGHDAVVEQFRRALGRGRLATGFLFSGPAGIGKRTFALKLAQAMLCQERPEAAVDPCEHCQACAMVLAGTHPDIDQVGKPADKSFIPVELLIGDREHRGREGLCHRIGLKPYMGGRKVAIIDDADFMNAEGANCLLKTLEEPPPQSVLILIGTSPAKQLPTIRSRCQLIRFRPLPVEVVARLLVAKGLVGDAAEAQRLAQHSEGSIERALDLSDRALWDFRTSLFARLAAPALESVGFAPTVIGFVEEAGKEASARRSRLRQVIGFAGDFYRRLMEVEAGAAPPADADLRRFLVQAMRDGRGGESTARCLDRCLEAAEQVDRNANQTTLIEAWLDDLAGLTR